MPSNFPLLRSLTKDDQSEVEAVVTGKIPEWVNGTLFRNGPGRYEYGDKEYRHLFDGHACVHKFRIENGGKVFYSNKFLETNHFKKVKSENRLYPVFGTSDPCSSLFGRFQSYYKGESANMDNTNVNIVPYGNEHLYALTETNMICKLDPLNLKILQIINVTNYIPSATTTIAHPHIEEDGGWIIMGMNTRGKIPHYNFIRYKGGKETVNSTNICERGEVIAKVPSSHNLGLSYFHSFGLSKNYIIYLETALIFDFRSYLIGLVTNRSFADNLYMNKNWNTRIHIINRHTGEIVKQELITDPLFVFHHTNAFEKVDSSNNITELIIDICAHDVNNFDIQKLTYKDAFGSGSSLSNLGAEPRRITVPMGEIQKSQMEEETTGVKKQIYCKIETQNANYKFEFPVINYRYNGLPYTYFYGTNVFKAPYSIIKQNVVNPSEFIEKSYFEDGKICFPSEPIFVENPNPQSEDDGVLLVMVLAEENDFLSILDAKDLSEIARADLPQGVKGATSFHGFFAKSSQFSKLNQ